MDKPNWRTEDNGAKAATNSQKAARTQSMLEKDREGIWRANRNDNPEIKVENEPMYAHREKRAPRVTAI